MLWFVWYGRVSPACKKRASGQASPAPRGRRHLLKAKSVPTLAASKNRANVAEGKSCANWQEAKSVGAAHQQEAKVVPMAHRAMAWHNPCMMCIRGIVLFHPYGYIFCKFFFIFLVKKHPYPCNKTNPQTHSQKFDARTLCKEKSLALQLAAREVRV